jgi:glycolate oxidase FAD binding subunit
VSAGTASLEALLESEQLDELLLGGRTIPLVVPSSVEQAAELLRHAARERLRVLPVGLGTKLGWCRPPRRADFALSTRALRGVVEYEPGEGTVTALAGTRMSALADAVRAGGHRLTPRVPRAAEATLGGVLAAGQSGPDRLRFGPARHHLLGARALMGDGALTKSGGRLVKNVTGYDLHRLYCGSHGTLCLIVEASLRLFPLPEATAVGRARFEGAAEALEAASRVLAGEPKPTSVTIALDGGAELLVELDGRAEVVAWEREVTARALPALEWCEDEDARQLAEAAAAHEPDAHQVAALHVGCLPTRVPAVLELLERAVRAAGLEPSALLSPGVATLDVPLPGLAPDAGAALVRDLRAALAPLSARLAARGLDWSRVGELDPFGEPSAGLYLMHRLKQRLDADGRFASGRFHGGL